MSTILLTQAKPFWQSRTLLVNAALILVFAIGLVVQAAGVLELDPRLVVVLGILAGVLNLLLRLNTSAPVSGTPAAAASVSLGTQTVGAPTTIGVPPVVPPVVPPAA